MRPLDGWTHRWAFYLHYPERVKSLVLVATFTGFRSVDNADRQRFIDLRKKTLVKRSKEPKDIAPVVAKTLVGPGATRCH